MSWRKFRGRAEANLRVSSRSSPSLPPRQTLGPGIGSSIGELRSDRPGFTGPHTSPSSYRRTRGINPPVRSLPSPNPLLRLAQTKLLPSGRRRVFILSIEARERAARNEVGSEGGSEESPDTMPPFYGARSSHRLKVSPPWKNITFLLEGPNKCNSVTARSLSRLSSETRARCRRVCLSPLLKIAPHARHPLSNRTFEILTTIGIPEYVRESV